MIHGIVAGALANLAIGPTSDKWRFVVTSNQRGDRWTGVRDLEFRETPGGADQTYPGMAITADNEASAAAAFAIDADVGTRWQPTSHLGYLELDFPEDIALNQIALRGNINFRESPNAFRIDRWDGATWQTHWTEPLFGWHDEVQYVFTRHDPDQPGYARWRVYVTGSNGGFINTRDIELFDTLSGGSDLTSYPPAAGEGPLHWNMGNYGVAEDMDLIFDNDTGTNYGWGNNPPVWVGWRFNRQVDIKRVKITATGGVGSFDGGPTALSIDYFDPVLDAWVTKWNHTNISWTGTETKEFKFGDPVNHSLNVESRYHRLRATGNIAGAGQWKALQARELEFRPSVGGAKLVGTMTGTNVQSGLVGANANDGNQATFYQGGSGFGTCTEILTLDMGVGNAGKVLEIAYSGVFADGGMKYCPSGFVIEYSHNGTTWWTRWSKSGLVDSDFTDSVLRFFTP